MLSAYRKDEPLNCWAKEWGSVLVFSQLWEARFDGKFVFTTNTELSSEEVAVTYKNLLQVECAFRSLKDILSTRPTYHKTAENMKSPYLL